MPPRLLILQLYKNSHIPQTNKLIIYATNKNIERVSHKGSKIAQVLTKYVLEISVYYLLLLFTFAKTKINKSLIGDSVTAAKKVLSFCLKYELLCIKNILECMLLSLLLTLLSLLLTILLD